MKTFRDKTGREWTVEIDLAAVARVLDLTGVDLTKILSPGCPVEERLSNPSTLLSVICAALKPQLDAAGLAPQRFGSRLDEESGEAAGVAVYEATIDFFRPRKRESLGRAFRMAKTAYETLSQVERARFCQAAQSRDFERVVRTAAGSKVSAGGSPEPSASIHAPSASAN